MTYQPHPKIPKKPPSNPDQFKPSARNSAYFGHQCFLTPRVFPLVFFPKFQNLKLRHSNFSCLITVADLVEKSLGLKDQGELLLRPLGTNGA